MMKNKSQMSDKPAPKGDKKEGQNNGEGITKYQTLIIHGDKYTTLLTKKYESRIKWQNPNEKHILSFIPGTVTEIFVKEGQSLKKGEKMMMLEAMKMLTVIELPIDGKIKKIHVKVGDKIPKGTLMIELA